MSALKFNKRGLFLMVFTYFLVRIVCLMFFIDLGQKDYGEYGYITENIHNGYGFSLFTVIDGRANHEYNPAERPYPSAYMPPAYVAFLYPFFYSNDVYVRNVFIVLVQMLIGLIILYYLYKVTESYFSREIAIGTCWAYILIPEFVYSVLVFNSIVFYHLIILIVFLLLYEINKKNFRIREGVLLAISCSVLIYFRAEFALFVLILLGIFLLKKKFKFSLMVAAIVVLSISPWIVRNYIVFERIIPMTTTTGLNFYRGNNNLYIGNWGDDYLVDKIIENSYRNDYEVVMNDIYIDYSLEIVKEQFPGKFLENLGAKFLFYLTINPNEANSRNPIYFVPWFVMLGLGIFGIYKSYDPGKYNYFYIFFLYSVFIAVVFIPLPRYQIMMKILLIPFAVYGADEILSRSSLSKKISSKLSSK